MLNLVKSWQILTNLVKYCQSVQYCPTCAVLSGQFLQSCWYLVSPLDWGLWEKRFFSFWCQFSRSKINFIFLKFCFHFRILNRRTASINNTKVSHPLWHCQFHSFLNMVYLVRACSIFNLSLSNSLTIHQNSLRIFILNLKIYWISLASKWNSTIVITIARVLKNYFVCYC